jgi:excinuclease UvrABC nuclease subunit
MSTEIGPRFTSLESFETVHLPNYPGIYFFCQGQTVVYVGHAKNIARRITGAHQGKDFDSVMVMCVPEEQLRAVEMYWIQRLRPRLNSRVGRSKLDKVTISIRLSQDVLAQIRKASRKLLYRHRSFWD